MSAYRIAVAAESDLDGIAEYTLAAWGVHRAESYIQSLENTFVLLAAQTGLGRQCSHLAPGMRRFEFRHHVIFYREEPHGITITRVLHERMSAQSRFLED